MMATTPTTEQLANFACVLVSGPGYSASIRDLVKSMFENNPKLRERWLEHHREFQRKSNELAEEIRAKEDNNV